MEADLWSAFPAKAGIQQRSRVMNRLEAPIRNKPNLPRWTPAFAGDAVERSVIITAA